MKPTSIRKVKSAERTLDLLECLAAASGPLNATALAEALGVPKSSMFHLVGTLVDRGYVIESEPNRYRLGTRLGDLVRGAGDSQYHAKLMQPILEELSALTNETCGFNGRSGDEVEVLGTVSGRQALTYIMRKGDLAPLYAVSAGKALLAAMEADWFDSYLRRVQFEKFAANTIMSADRLRLEIERARAEGFGMVDEEFTPGIVGIAMAVRQGGETVGAFNVVIPAARFDAMAASLVRTQLRKAVARAEAILEHTSSR